MTSLPKAGIYRIKHVSTGTLLTMSKQIIGSPKDAGQESKDAKNGHYYFHMQWNHYVARMDDTDKIAKLARAQYTANEKWIFEFVGPLDKTIPEPTLHQHIHYPFAPGDYKITNVGTGTVMDLETGSGTNPKVVGNQANGSDSQKWHLRPTATGTNMAIKTLGGKMTGLSDLRQGTIVELFNSVDTNYMLTFTPADKGFWISPIAYPFFVYDLTGANPADGTEICLWPKNDQDHQKWYFDPA
ncbi:unnamed protein product [Rhizoctonia solani]|uniref:Ricin B lectin domain-containing protein n=1 Tax=Rhizoctonia solani TaxID=456999 RepID=A0A8H3GI53_9AGAM|nr:unnamed protein product [Rhizoctonia solani]